MKKIRVGIIFGGRSTEHEVSLLSARNIIDALDQDRYELVLISIDKEGVWHKREGTNYLLHPDDPKQIQLQGEQQELAIAPKQEGGTLVSSNGFSALDVVFPVLHGSYGEDGTIQGLLKMAKIPFVGAGVLGSAIGMDKEVMKRLLKEAGILIGKFKVVKSLDRDVLSFDSIVEELGLPFFVKPANGGSSVGVSKVNCKEDFCAAVASAFLYDKKIIIEEFISGREIECAVLGNAYPEASLPGELIPSHEFYSYEAKYLDEEGASFAIPVSLDPLLVRQIQETAIEVFKALCCEGMARVDFFLTKEGKLYVNEINTIPGFTKISMYPRLWEVSGLSYSRLLDRLIDLALDRHRQESNLKTTC